MKKAINPATLNAATIGTANIAELPSNPPNTSFNAVVGSSVATERRLLVDSKAWEGTDVVVVVSAS